jgi:hypothetical protein
VPKMDFKLGARGVRFSDGGSKIQIPSETRLCDRNGAGRQIPDSTESTQVIILYDCIFFLCSESVIC